MITNRTFISVESVLHQFYGALNFDALAEPDYECILECFHPDAIITPPICDTGGKLCAFSGVEFIAHMKGLLAGLDSGREYQVSAQHEIFGNVANAFSRYEFAVGDKVVSSGVNSFQFMRDDQRWWIMSLAWDRESK